MNNNLVSSAIFDILSLFKIPTATFQSMWSTHCEKKLEESRDILVEEIQQGDFSRLGDDDKVSLLHRYAQAAMNGAARINLRLLAKAINSLAQNEKLASPIYANEFNRYATVLETLSDEEIQLLANLYILKKENEGYIKQNREAEPGINADPYTKLITSLEFTDPDGISVIQATAGALLRTGLIYQKDIGYGGKISYCLSPFFDKIISLVDFQDALNKEQNKSNNS